MKVLIASLLLLSSPAYSKITQAPNVSVTAAADDADSVAKQNAYLYGMDSDGVNRRVQVNSSGQVLTAGGSGTSTIGAVGVTSTVMPSWTVVSTASYSLTGTTSIDLATVAGSGKIFMYKISALGPNAGFYYGTAPSSTWVSPVSYYAVSTTPVVEDYLTTGTFLQLSATASAVTVTVQAQIYKLTQVVP